LTGCTSRSATSLARTPCTSQARSAHQAQHDQDEPQAARRSRHHEDVRPHLPELIRQKRVPYVPRGLGAAARHLESHPGRLFGSAVVFGVSGRRHRYAHARKLLGDRRRPLAWSRREQGSTRLRPAWFGGSPGRSSYGCRCSTCTAISGRKTPCMTASCDSSPGNFSGCDLARDRRFRLVYARRDFRRRRGRRAALHLRREVRRRDSVPEHSCYQ
jgi:hypothetical protein